MMHYLKYPFFMYHINYKPEEVFDVNAEDDDGMGKDNFGAKFDDVNSEVCWWLLTNDGSVAENRDAKQQLIFEQVWKFTSEIIVDQVLNMDLLSLEAAFVIKTYHPI